jgi:hypothetical protein
MQRKHRSKLRLILAACACIVLALITRSLVYLMMPQTIQGYLTILESTPTNSLGQILISVTNTSPWPVQFYPRIESKQHGLWPPYPNNVAPASLAKELSVASHSKAEFLISPPSSEPIWRVWIDYFAESDRNRSVERLQRLLGNGGLSGIAQKFQYDLGGYLTWPHSDNPLDRTGDRPVEP